MKKLQLIYFKLLFFIINTALVCSYLITGKNDYSDNRGVVTCSICRESLDIAIGWLDSGATEAEIIDRLTTLCVDLGIENERVCRNTLEMNVKYFIWIYEAKNVTENPLTTDEMCGMTLYPDCAFNSSEFEWSLNLDFLSNKPAPEYPEIPPEGTPKLKILQFTDVHVDPNYAPEHNAECDEPMCCRYDQGIPKNITSRAGYWGDYRHCDTPLHSFKNMLRHASQVHQDVSYIIFTGDIIDHASWNTNEQYNSDLISLVIQEFYNYFPNTPVMSILGNHESHPSNVFWDPLKSEIPTNLRNEWLYNLAANLWTHWLPVNLTNDILSGGHYSYEITTGLYLIGLNTMWCYTGNWWLMYDNYDPANELIWFANQLLIIEQEGKKAHILAHHPSGDYTCYHFWSSQYRRIIDRFENTVLAQFHGHTHFDQFSVYYDLFDPQRPTTVSFTAGSGTPYIDVNPNYRVYTMDSETFRLLNHETWYYNLTEANLNGNATLPNWQILYSFNDVFGTTALFPEQFDSLVNRMANDTNLQNQYFRYYVKAGDTSLAMGCDNDCLHQIMCETVITVINDLTKCNEIFSK